MPASAQWRTTTGDTQGSTGAATNRQHPADDRGDAGMARVSIADGDVQVLHGDTGDRMQARGGMPLIGKG